MNDREITELLEKVATKENIEKAVALAASVNPVAGVAAGIVGAIIVTGVNAAKAYMTEVDEIPLIPPETPAIFTYEESIALMKRLNLIDNFQQEIDEATPALNPYTYNSHRDRIRYIATFISKAVNRSDPIFNAFFFGYINNKNYIGIWNNRQKFRQFKGRLQEAIPPAKFTSMSKEIWNKVTGTDSAKQLRGILVSGVKSYIESIDANIDIDSILKILG